MASAFAVVNGAARSLSALGAILADPCTYNFMIIDCLPVRSIGFPSASLFLNKLLCLGHGKMQDALTLLVIVVSNYMLALTPFVQLSGETVHFAKSVIIRASCAGEAATSEL